MKPKYIVLIILAVVTVGLIIPVAFLALLTQIPSDGQIVSEVNYVNDTRACRERDPKITYLSSKDQLPKVDEDMPLMNFDVAVVTDNRSDRGIPYLKYVFCTTQSVEAVQAYYQVALEKNGWTPSNVEAATVRIYQKDIRSVQVYAVTYQDKTGVAIQYDTSYGNYGRLCDPAVQQKYAENYTFVTPKTINQVITAKFPTMDNSLQYGDFQTGWVSSELGNQINFDLCPAADMDLTFAVTIQTLRAHGWQEDYIQNPGGNLKFHKDKFSVSLARSGQPAGRIYKATVFEKQ